MTLMQRKELKNKLFLTACFRMISQTVLLHIYFCFHEENTSAPSSHGCFFSSGFVLDLCLLYRTATRIEYDQVIFFSTPPEAWIGDFITGSMIWSLFFPVNKIFPL